MKSFLFQPVDAVQWISNENYDSSSSNFEGESRAPGVPLFYYLKGEAKTVKVEVLDGKRVIFSLDGEKSPGVHNLHWNFSRIIRERTEAEKNQLKRQLERMKEYGMTESQIAARFGSLDYIMGSVQPGKYSVRLTVDGTESVKSFSVLKDYWY
ncbi:MAG: hypothetical protein R2744_00080 [Bacteroidales bacterium]